MPVKNKKIEKVFEAERGAPIFGEHPSPHILDLKKIMVEKAEVKKMSLEPKAPKNKMKREAISRLTFVRIHIAVKRDIKNFFSFLFRGPQKLFQGFFVAVRAIPRFFKFLNFAFVDCKKILGFGALAFLFILPLQTFSYYESLKKTESAALGGAEEAYNNFIAGGAKVFDADFGGAAEDFERAADSFTRSGEEIKKVNSVVLSILRAMPLGGEKLEAGEALLFAGQKLTFAGENILQSLTDFSAKDSDKKLTQKIKMFRNRLVVILPEVAAASEKIYAVKSQTVPEDKREIFVALQGKLPQVVADIKNLISVSDLMIKFLGDETDKRYLMIFQNPGEIRPTGGFIGSVALVDFDRGEIKNMEVPGGGSYDFQGSLKERIVPPVPLQLINDRWQLQDANWFFDFPTSAKKIKWFYEKSGGPTVDGVIAVNADLVADLLAAVGPIDMSEYGKILTKENFVEEVQKSVEFEYDKQENKPKKIIADMAPKLITKLTSADPKQFGQILAILFRALGRKDILLYSAFPEIEHEIKNFEWGGEVKSVPEKTDYLAVVNSNIAGEKTDRVIKQTINFKTNITEDGYIKNKLTITRVHEGIKGELFTGVRNVDYLRVYVPSGSTLLSAQGFESPPANLFEKQESGYKTDLDLKNSEEGALVDAASGTMIINESGKTVFGNWVQVDPGEEATITLEYLLPFRLSLPITKKTWWDNLSEKFSTQEEPSVSYQLLVQKQPGMISTLDSNLTFPNNWQAAWHYGENFTLEATHVRFGNQLDVDKFYLINFKNKK